MITLIVVAAFVAWTLTAVVVAVGIGKAAHHPNRPRPPFETGDVSLDPWRNAMRQLGRPRR